MKINLEKLCYELIEERKKKKKKKKSKNKRSSKYYGWGYIGYYGNPGMYDGVGDAGGGDSGGV
jgi:hypothetical protein